MQDAQGTVVKERRKAYYVSCRGGGAVEEDRLGRQYGLHVWMGREQHMSFPG